MQKKENVNGHHSMIESLPFERSLAAARLEYLRYLTSTSDAKDPNEALSRHYKSVGAEEFIHFFLNLAEAPDFAKPVIRDNLDHKA